jgi:glycosyltransferase involved in cell wall biosynthesis
MKIAFVIDRTEPFYRGGYERRAWELARRLTAQHEVTIFTSAPKHQVYGGVRFVAVRPQVAYFKKDGFRDLTANVAYALALLRYRGGNQRFDVVDCNATPFLHIFSAELLARHWRAQFLVTAHEALADTFDGYFRARGRGLSSRLGPVARHVYFTSQHRAKRLIASSEVTAEHLRKEGFRSVAVCAGGVSRCLSPKSAPTGRFVFVGRLVPNKKVDILLEAFALAKQGSAAKVRSLTILGDGPDRVGLEGLAARLGIAPYVQFMGDVSDEQKWHVLASQVDTFVSASPREGFSLAALEALSAGNPAIISYRPGLSQQGATEYLRDRFNGIITDGSRQSLAQAITELASDEELYRRLSENATQIASAYLWENVAHTLTDIYEGAVVAGPNNLPLTSDTWTSSQLPPVVR